MGVQHMRIDDRLIHGQIVTAWIADSKADTIVVADDNAAADPTQRMLLQFATPKSVTLMIQTLEEAYQFLSNETSGKNILLILRSPATANQLFEAGFHIDVVNVGNISNTRSQTGRKKLLPFIFVEQQDVDNLKAIAGRGVRLDVRAVPTDRSVNALDLLK